MSLRTMDLTIQPRAGNLQRHCEMVVTWECNMVHSQWTPQESDEVRVYTTNGVLCAHRQVGDAQTGMRAPRPSCCDACMCPMLPPVTRDPQELTCGSGRAVPRCRHIGCVVSHGGAAMSCCVRVIGTCVTCVTCAGRATMTRRGGGGGHRKVCRGTCRDMGKLHKPKAL